MPPPCHHHHQSSLVLLVSLISLLAFSQASPADSLASSSSSLMSRPEQELVSRYLLARLLEDTRRREAVVGQRRSDDQDPAPSIVYPQLSSQSIRRPLRKLLERAKQSIDVIDFRSSQAQAGREHVRAVRSRVAPSETISTFLPPPGDNTRSPLSECVDCAGEGRQSRFSMPLAQLGEKKYYLGIFFKANWYKAEQYCRFHGMHLASINSAEEQDNLEDHIQSFGMGHEHFWTSGTDQAEEGKFFWMSTGKPVTYENWNAGEPNNFQYENGEQEHCLELWNRDGKGLRWNDTPCSFETFFVCEV